MYDPSSANSFMKRRTPSMASASNVELEGHEHMRKPYDGTCFCNLTVSKKAGCNYFQWMDETHDDVTGVTKCSTNSKNVEIYESRLNRRGTWNLPNTFSCEELLMKEHMRRVEKLLISTIVLVVVGLIMSLIALIR
ncbi:hypothetical protein PIB30_053657 [Stylosanthes scabra]|uniref:Zinc finger GRF-type domain-containing protein n=1 Tax=Stylosanthes scabra TaxID=79078 RepID=A0ABU6ZHC2_9FABA|nr:hypothetical protein [Stylosanthes scabra]